MRTILVDNMRKLLVILLIAFILTGCGKKEIVKNEEKKDDNQVIQTGTLNCSALNNIKLIFNSSIFLTNDGKVYKIGNYSDGTNCKLISDNFVIKSIWNTEYLIDENNKVYDIDYNDLVIKLTGININSGYFSIINKNKDIIKYHCSLNVDIGDICYYLKDDGKLYTADKKYKNNISYLDNITDNMFDSHDEKIVDFDGYPAYDSQFERNVLWIRTDKSFYVSKMSNDSTCMKYEDVKCSYELVKDEYLSSIIDDVAYIQYWNYGETDYCITYVSKDGKEYSDKKCYGG